ncbi:unnamed protein product, partial [Bubo scandiacus]
EMHDSSCPGVSCPACWGKKEGLVQERLAMPTATPQLSVFSRSKTKPRAACVLLYNSLEMRTEMSTLRFDPTFLLMRFVWVNPHVSLEFTAGSGYV